MRILALFFFCLLPYCSMANQCSGSVIFYFGKADNEVESDYRYYFDSVSSVLKNRNIDIKFLEKLPSEFTACSGKKVEIILDKFEYPLGYLLVNSNGETKYFSGVLTDVDLLELTEKFFK